MGKPKIRFKGYNDEWEQRKLGDWGNFYYGRSCPKWSVTEDATIPCIRYGELYTKFGAKIDRVYSYTNMPPENLRFSRGTEVLIPRVGEDPMDYNHCTWLSMQDVAIGEMISVFNTDNNPLFTATMFNATLQNEFAMRVEGGSVTNLYFEKLKNIEVSFPSIPEQKKIAAYFENLDRLITLHQRKCDEMKTLKKYMLQKMFPQNGQKISEIRFEGFTDEWEQRKLGELGSLKNGMNFSKEAMGIGFPFVNLQNIFGNNVIDVINLGKAMASNSQLKDYNLLNGDVLFVRSSVKLEGVGEAALVPQNLENTTYSGFIIRFRDEYGLDNNFKRFIFGIESVRNQIMAQATNSANKNISQTVLENLCLKIPNKSEQEKIGLYFSDLDNLITLHQRKCDELKSIKKFMLQNMFI